MKKKHNKHVQNALNALGWVWDTDEPFYDEKDVKNRLAYFEMMLEEYKNEIEKLQEWSERAIRNIENSKTLLHQIKIEEYKELNPHAKDIF